MDQQNPTNWRQMFEAKRRDRPPEAERSLGQENTIGTSTPVGGYDDGFDPSQHDLRGEMPRPPLTPEEITDEAAMALALDEPEYKPWVLQRGRGRPAMMLHLRRFEPKSGLWIGWQLAYPHLVAVEYTGDTMLSLDFGARQFVIQGSGLDELVSRLQSCSVLMVQEYSARVWPYLEERKLVSEICRIGTPTLSYCNASR
jgi:hypothetical protein